MATRTEKAQFIVELDTAQAEAALDRLRQGGGAPGGGGPTGGGRTGGRGAGAGGAPVRGRSAGAGGGSGGFGVGDIAALVLAFKGIATQLGGAALALSDSVNEAAIQEIPGLTGQLAKIQAARAAGSFVSGLGPSSFDPDTGRATPAAMALGRQRFDLEMQLRSLPAAAGRDVASTIMREQIPLVGETLVGLGIARAAGVTLVNR